MYVTLMNIKIINIKKWELYVISSSRKMLIYYIYNHIVYVILNMKIINIKRKFTILSSRKVLIYDKI